MAHIPSFENATLIDLYRRYPPLAKHVLGLAEAAFSLTNEITRAEGELLAAYISELNGCDYCRGVHGEAATACGLNPPEGLEPNYGGERWRPVFDYVRVLTLSPASVTPEHASALLQAGWSEDAVAQLAALTSVVNVLNRLVDGLGLRGDADFFQAAGKRLAGIGYAGTAKQLGVDS